MDKKKIGITHINAKIQALADLDGEIKEHDYQTVNQISGHIHNSIEWLEKYKKEKGYE